MRGITMTGTQTPRAPLRVTDLIERHNRGLAVVCRTRFDILPVDFKHRSNPFKAYIFLCQYSGTIDGSDYSFRKCYARGCPHNLCPHVSQAVLIANRYLQRDYYRLENAGIPIEKKLFSLEEMVLKFDSQHDEADPAMTLFDYVQLAGKGQTVAIRPTLEFVSAVEHFDRFENKMIFLMADFAIICQGTTHHLERCLACYPVDKEAEERQAKVDLANARLELLYQDLESAGGQVDKVLFE
jgi:hypothetical protein